MEMKYRKGEGFACQHVLSVRVSEQLALRLHPPCAGAAQGAATLQGDFWAKPP